MAQVARNIGAFSRTFSFVFGRVLREQSFFIIIICCYLIIAFVLARTYGQSFSLELYGRAQMAFLLNFGVVCLVYQIARFIIRGRPDRPLRPVWTYLTGDFALGKRLICGFPAFLLLPLMLSAFTSVKQSIPETLGFVWDETFARWDAWLHGGEQPWALLQPILGQPWTTVLIDKLYGPPWFWMMLAMQFWMIFSFDPRRLRLLLTFTLSFILLGSLTATLFGSAGPVYYSHFVAGPDPFASLMTYLESVAGPDGLIALQAQRYLWESYQAGFLGVGVGMSAMPSMHMAMACLFCIIVWPWHWSLRGLALAYLLVLQIGSIHLGWHYAIDGYAGIIGTLAIWHLTAVLDLGRIESNSRTSPDPTKHQ